MTIVFLSYLNRSGSTFLVNQLSRSPEVCVCPEADILFELLLRNPFKIVRKRHLLRWQKCLDQDEKFQSWRLPVQEIINSNQKGKTRFQLFIHIIFNFQKKYYPKSKTIIFKQNFLLSLRTKKLPDKENNFLWISLLRNPRAIYASQKTTITPQTGKSMSENPLAFIKNWNRYFSEVTRQKTSKHLIVNYEELIDSFDNEIDKIAHFLELNTPFNENYSGDTHVQKWLNPKYRNIHTYISNPPQKIFIDKWRGSLTNNELYVLNKFCKPNSMYALNNNSYPNFIKPILFLIILYCKTLFVKTIDKLRMIKFKFKNMI